jgi:fatty acid desaturase
MCSFHKPFRRGRQMRLTEPSYQSEGKMNVESAVERQDKGSPQDDYVGEVPVRLTKEELRELSRINPLRSSFHIVAEWLAIFFTISLCQRFSHPLLYVAAIIVIGSRQHALMILMHDGVHNRLFRNRRLNDWVAEIPLAWPNLISARSYRRNHFGHHRYLNTAQDPDWARRQGDPAWVFPKRWSDLARLLLRDLSGLGAIGLLRLARSLLSQDTGVTKRFLFARYGFYLAVGAIILWAGAVKLLLLYWIVPLFTWLILIFRIRSIAEHSAIGGRSPAYAQTRTTRASILERLFIAPKNVSYHLEHHFYPSVPFYNLPKLHALLQSKPGFRESAHITPTYFGVLQECVGGARATARGGGDRNTAPVLSGPAPACAAD